MALNIQDLKTLVATADFDRLIGEVEGQFFDVKSQPYRFNDGIHAKREFAKDVAAFANAGGGYILVGFATKTTTLQTGEEVSEVRPVENSMFDAGRHLDLLSEWLYPGPRNVDVTWIPFGGDASKGIGVVFVPPQDEHSKPFLIRRAVEGDKSTEMLIGYPERRRDTTAPHRIEEIHQALRTGLNLERELLGRIENIELLVERHFSAQVKVATSEKREQALKERIGHLLEEARG